MKYNNIWFLVCVICILGKAELHAQQAYTEVKPSVNAQQFISAASMSNGLSTGQISVNIPLFNLQSKGFDVPISISFNGGGITHESEASSIGLGWSLLAGGVITQNIKGNSDLIRHPSNKRLPWHYTWNYLQTKRDEAYTSPNEFVNAMQAVGYDEEPDLFKYSFLGHSGDICLEYSEDGEMSWTMYPDRSFRLIKTNEGFKITANDGVEYSFEAIEKKEGASLISTSWFLTKIKTLTGDSATLHYADDYSYDQTQPTPSGYEVDRSKRLTRIDSDYGYVTFVSAGRSDKFHPESSKTSRKISNIELYNNEDALIKGFEFDNNDYIESTQLDYYNWENWRLKLSGIREYGHNGEYLPYYKFEYDHHFDLPKNSEIQSSNPLTLPKGTWAHNPGFVASVDRDNYGAFYPRVDCYGYTPNGDCMYYFPGFQSHADIMGGHSLSSYLCLTKIEYPSGGSESYYYENHDYGFYANSRENLPAFVNQKISGKRLWKKEIIDGIGNTQTFLYKYRLHDQNYQITNESSGVLVNPSIHTSTTFQPDGDSNSRWFAASPFQTLRPQNSSSGTPVHYTEIEETQISGSEIINGKKIYYYERMYALPSANYIYINYGLYGGIGNLLINLPNTLYGMFTYPALPIYQGYSTSYFTYIAYPVGSFMISHFNEGILLKELTINANGEINRKVENNYASAGGMKTQYGLVVKTFDDNNLTPDNGDLPVDPGLGNPPGDNPFYPSIDKKRYLIAQTQIQFGIRELLTRTTTIYYGNDSIVENQSFGYNLNMLKTNSTTTSSGQYQVKEFIYPNEIAIPASGSLSGQANAIKKMNDLNIIGIPIQTTLKNGNNYTNGTYNTFKQLANGAIVIDSIFSLGIQEGASVPKPYVNSNGLVIKNGNFISEKAFLSYDNNGNPTTIVGNDGVKETIVWGYEGQYPIARIVNYTDSQLKDNPTLLNQISLLENFTTITESDRSGLSNCNQAIRNNLPEDVMVTNYTYEPLIGITSITDQTGITTFYEYDSFNRLFRIKDHKGNIMQQYEYHYLNK